MYTAECRGAEQGHDVRGVVVVQAIARHIAGAVAGNGPCSRGHRAAITRKDRAEIIVVFHIAVQEWRRALLAIAKAVIETPWHTYRHECVCHAGYIVGDGQRGTECRPRRAQPHRGSEKL